MTYTRDEFVGLLKSQVGYQEGRDPDGNWNNDQKFSKETPGLEWSNRQPWCATFEAWGAHQVGMDAIWPMTASCATAVQWWQDHGRWTEYPVLGGPYYMGPGGADHTGTVLWYDSDPTAPGGGGWIWGVEGNTNLDGGYQGNSVQIHQRPRRGPDSPFGYGVPAYDEGTISADPALGGVKAAAIGAPTPTPAPAPAPAPHPTPGPTTHPRFPYPVGIHPGGTSPSARPLQEALKRTGWMDKDVPESDHYGPLTQQGVAGFNLKHHFNDAGVSWDPAIGPHGWALLMTFAYGTD